MNSCHELHCNKMLSIWCLNLMLGVTYIQQFGRVLYLQVSIAFFYCYKLVFFKYHGHVILKILWTWLNLICFILLSISRILNCKRSVAYRLLTIILCFIDATYNVFIKCWGIVGNPPLIPIRIGINGGLPTMMLRGKRIIKMILQACHA